MGREKGERESEREGHGFPTVMYSTDQTQPYEKKTGSRSAFCVHLGSAMADPGLIVSRTQADPEQTLISGVDLGATKNVQISLHNCAFGIFKGLACLEAVRKTRGLLHTSVRKLDSKS